jgi:16S rRNA (guanine966-N2)-methyltransferase
VHLQIAGLNMGYDAVVVRPGEGDSRSHWYFSGDRLLAVDAMNDARAYMVGKRLLEAGRPRPGRDRGPCDEPQGAAQAVRIVGGRFRGLALADVGRGDPAAHLRPTSDRVRESLFNVLTGRPPRRPGEGARVLDLFAGTGALGLEALSRGAAHVDLRRERRGRAGAAAPEHREDPDRGRDRTMVARDATSPGPGTPHDLVFLDPPYGKGLGEAALSAARADGWIAPAALVVWEDGAPMPAPESFAPVETRRYGSTHITFLRAP